MRLLPRRLHDEATPKEPQREPRREQRGAGGCNTPLPRMRPSCRCDLYERAVLPYRFQVDMHAPLEAPRKDPHHGTWRHPAHLEHRALRGHAALHRPFPLFKAEWWERHQLHVAGLWSLLFLIPFTAVYGFGVTLRAAARSVVVDYIPLHRAAAGPVRRHRRHPRGGHHQGLHAQQRDHAGDRHVPGQLDRHDRRGHAAHPPRPARQHLARAQGAHRGVLHLPGGQHRRVPDAFGRPAAVPRVPARHPVLLDAGAHLAAAAAQHRAAPIAYALIDRHFGVKKEGKEGRERFELLDAADERTPIRVEGKRNIAFFGDRHLRRHPERLHPQMDMFVDPATGATYGSRCRGMCTWASSTSSRSP